MRTPFLELFARYLLEQEEQGGGNALVILPNRRAGLFLQHHLAAHSRKACWMPEILTITDFADRISGLRTVEPLDAVFILYDLYRGTKDEPESLDDFFHWGEVMVRDFDEIDKYLVDPEMLFRNITDLKEMEEPLAGMNDGQIRFIRQFWESFHTGSHTTEKELFLENWKSFPALYRQFGEKLRAEGMAYPGMQYREIVRRIQTGELEWAFPGKVLVAGFNALNGCEHAIFRWLQQHGAGFFWDHDMDYISDQVNEAGRFMRSNIREFPPAVALEDFQGIREEKDIRIFELPTDILQAKTAGRMVQESQESGPVSGCTDMAVVLCDEQLLVPLLLSLPGDAGDVNVTMGYPMEGTPVAGLVEGLFRLQNNHRETSGGRVTYFHEDVRTILLHPYMDRAGEPGTATLLARMARENLVQVPGEILNAPFHQKIFRPVTAPGELIGYLREVFGAILEDMEPTRERQLSELHREFIFRFLMQLNMLEQHLESWPDITLRLLERLIRKIVANLKIPFEGEPLAGLQVMGILETRLLDFSHVVLLSMNEEKMPASRPRPSYIPYSLRMAFGLPSREDMDAIYAYYFYRLLQRADRVDLLFNSTTEGMHTGEMSRYLHQLVYRLGIGVSRPGMEVLAREREELVIPHDSGVEALLRRFTLADEGGSILSPSAINTYIDCPLKFYLRYLARIGEPEEVAEEIDAAGFGTVVHETLRSVYEEMASANHGTVTGQALQDMAVSDRPGKVLKEAFVKHHFRNRAYQVIDGRNLILLKVMERIIRKVLSVDGAVAPFTLVHAEERFTRELAVGAGSGKVSLRIGGWIDRVDRTGAAIRVIDYKTGAANHAFGSLESLFDSSQTNRNGAALQTLLYAWLVSDAYRDVQIIPGLYVIRSLYQGAFDSRLQMGLHQNKEPIGDFSSVETRFMNLLESVLEEIFDPAVPFEQTKDESRCRVCDFAAICSRRIID